MIAEQALSRPLSGEPARIRILVIALIAASAMAASFMFGRSALEATARADAIAVAAEDQSFCASLGFSLETETFHRCIAGLGEIRLHQEQRLKDQATGLL